MVGTKTKPAFHWWITDPAAPRWSLFHALDGNCAGCCCGAPLVCPDCGGRVHQEPAVARTTLDMAHDALCQNCREDICGEAVESEDGLIVDLEVSQ
jgi:hypothetical protein